MSVKNFNFELLNIPIYSLIQWNVIDTSEFAKVLSLGGLF